MSNTIKQIVIQIKAGLTTLYANRLIGLYLFGSCARGETHRESDLDILIVLDHIDDYFAEVDGTGKLISELSLEHGISISRIFVTEPDWTKGESPFLSAVRREAVAA